MALADSAQLNKDFWDKLKPDESRVFLLFANKCLPKYIYISIASWAKFIASNPAKTIK